MNICKKKDELKKKLIKYYKYLNYLVKSISKKDLNNYVIQKGGFIGIIIAAVVSCGVIFLIFILSFFTSRMIKAELDNLRMGAPISVRMSGGKILVD